LFKNHGGTQYTNYFEKNEEDEDKEPLVHYNASIAELRSMVIEGEKLPVNLGSAHGKVSKMLDRAEKWMENYRFILVACGNKAVNQDKNEDNSIPKTASINLSELNAALNAASDLPIDLGDVIELRNMAARVKTWTDQAELIVPKNQTKRNTRGKGSKSGDAKLKHNLKELISLIEEASSLPNDINEDLTRLKAQLNDAQSWRIQAQCDLREIITGFQILSVERTAFIAKEASKLFRDSVEEKTAQSGRNPTKIVKVEISAKKVDMKVNKLVSILLDSANIVPIYTIEERIAEFLSEILSWCSKSASVTPDEVLGKLVLEKIAVYIEEGNDLMKRHINIADIGPNDIENLLIDLRKNWIAVIKKEQDRLRNLEKRGFRFHEWVKEVELILSSPEKISLPELQNYINESHKYPTSKLILCLFSLEQNKEIDTLALSTFTGIELVRKIRKRGKLATAWITELKDILESSSKMFLEDAKKIIAKGDKLGVTCVEVKSLRGQIRKSKAWALKVRKCSLEEGRTHIVDIQKLIGEHNDPSFLVTMPDELKTLKFAIRGYCLCRNPYEGFMIGCDGCEEWYHGMCVGISEVQAGRCEKYLCIRCIISRNYKDCKNEAGQILRKWKSKSELIKSRKHCYRNLQKRFKKADSDNLKWTAEIESCEQILFMLRSKSITITEEASKINHPPNLTNDVNNSIIENGNQYSNKSNSNKEDIEENIKKGTQKVSETFLQSFNFFISQLSLHYFEQFNRKCKRLCLTIQM